MSDYRTWRLVPGTLILLTALLASVACSGVSQEEFDTVSEDLNAARAQEQQIATDLAVAQSKLQTVETELDAARVQEQRIATDLAIAQSRIKDVEAELHTARSKLSEYSKIVEIDYPDLSRRAEEAQLLLSIFNGFYEIADGDSSGMVELLGKLDQIENTDIKEGLEYLMNSDDIADDEAGAIVMGWLIEAERLLAE